MRRRVPRRSPIGRLMRKGHDSSHPLKKKKKEGPSVAVMGGQWLGHTRASPPKADARSRSPSMGSSPFLFPRFACACGGRWDAVAMMRTGVARLHTHTAPMR